MTISIQDTIYEQFMQLVPAKKRSQYIEQLLAEAILKEKTAIMEADYEAMANDLESQEDAAFYQQFCGDIT
ncbi:hypothetical protein [uncultured Agitococcus sp.]|uniref:hypothetical protein n=1 Tax=uncultured Agitococcus sp. TaxID=1506599 RepID=UPI00260A88C3|nr:hypothetical protein [uncultured Agitococcus sp.]